MSTSIFFSVSSDSIPVLNQNNLGFSEPQAELSSSVNDMQKHIATLTSDKKNLEKRCRVLTGEKKALSNQVENLELAQKFIKKCAEGYRAKNQDFLDAVQRLEAENQRLKNECERLVRESKIKESQQVKRVSSFSDSTILCRSAPKDLTQTPLYANRAWVFGRGI